MLVVVLVFMAEAETCVVAAITTRAIITGSWLPSPEDGGLEGWPWVEPAPEATITSTSAVLVEALAGAHARHTPAR